MEKGPPALGKMVPVSADLGKGMPTKCTVGQTAGKVPPVLNYATVSRLTRKGGKAVDLLSCLCGGSALWGNTVGCRTTLSTQKMLLALFPLYASMQNQCGEG